MATLQVWEIKPRLPRADNSLWHATSTEGPVIVRAPDAKTARELASRAFARATSPGDSTDTIAGDPWQYDNLTSIEEYVGGEYVADGLPEVLSPAHDKPA